MIKTRTILAGVLAIGLIGTVGACGSSSSSSASSGFVVDSAPSSLFDGDQLTQPFAKPNVTLTDTSGKQFNLVQGTKGKLTLVYFGYTHCPDVCPTTMATLAATMRTLTSAQAAQVDVVFISSDPKRDTPAVLHAWLGQYDPKFIGLTGAFGTIQSAASSLGITIEPPTDTNGQYTVTHGAEVIAFDAEGKGDLVYTSGTSVPQFQHDIPLLLAGRDG
ncbi:SCO family protein [Actinospica sp.]|uniref:SCO family protein n=1 Tax=Actinospica sp. TaxID=1872142 RepID=UPI002CE210C9|nr:SCO family protein [Actinospica sp.]HWG23905.1 SCO family protein [Actinospica sp.]